MVALFVVAVLTGICGFVAASIPPKGGTTNTVLPFSRVWNSGESHYVPMLDKDWNAGEFHCEEKEVLTFWHRRENSVRILFFRVRRFSRFTQFPSEQPRFTGSLHFELIFQAFLHVV